MKTTDVAALGELLIDFSGEGNGAQGNPLFEANPGGAPCNVLAMLAKLGRKTAFIGKVGADPLGRMLKKTAAALGIDTACLYEDPEVPTTLAFVHNAPDGERSFSFYRNPGADVMLRSEEVREDVIAGARIFHYGTLSMTHPGVREATERAVALAEKHGLLRSFDPNFRFALWRDEKKLYESAAFGLAHCDILKIADDELCRFTNTEDPDRAVGMLRERYPIRLITVTMGRGGSTAYCRGGRVHVPAFPTVGTVDTTGAGDTFCACVLNGILESGMQNLSEETLRGILRFANAAAAIVTTRKGALTVMPSREEILRLMEKS